MAIKNIFIIAATNSYEIIRNNLTNILFGFNHYFNCNIQANNVIFPYDYFNPDIKKSIIEDSKNYRIKSYIIVQNSDCFTSLTNLELEKQIDIKARELAYENWLVNKLNYSKQHLSKADACIIINDDNLKDAVKRELKAEINMARQRQIPIYNIEREDVINLNEKIKILRQKINKKKDIF